MTTQKSIFQDKLETRKRLFSNVESCTEFALAKPLAAEKISSFTNSDANSSSNSSSSSSTTTATAVIPYSSLSAEQQQFVNVLRARVHDIQRQQQARNKPKFSHLALLAGAGAGKSYLIRFLAQYNTPSQPSLSASSKTKKEININSLLHAPNDPYPSLTFYVAVTSTTGLSAVNLQIPGACPIHGKLKLGHYSSSAYRSDAERRAAEERILQAMKHDMERREELNKIQVLVIDEISMLDARQMNLVGEICRRYAPFLLLVLVGDFHQLPPVGFSFCRQKPLKKYQGEESSEPQTQQQLIYAFESEFWDACVDAYQLTGNFRHSQDKCWQELLVRCSNGQPLAGDLQRLNRRVIPSVEQAMLHTNALTVIFSTNAKVDMYNRRQLLKLDFKTSIVVFRKLRLSQHLVVETKSNAADRALVTEYLANSRIPERLELREGAQVMLTKNLDIKAGLVNGLCGIVKETFLGFQAVRVFFPFLNKTILFRPVVSNVYNAENKLLAEIEQLPLVHAWAMTVFKVQGLTISGGIYIDLDEFCPHMMYVALSRAPLEQDVFLRRPIEGALWMDERVLRFYRDDDDDYDDDDDNDDDGDDTNEKNSMDDGNQCQ